MRNLRSTAPWRLRACLAATALLAALALPATPPASADEAQPYAVEVGDVTAKVGEAAVLHAEVSLHDGYRVLEAYNNRVMQLSSWDDGVTFDRKVVNAAVHGDALVFAIGLKPTKPGKHPINGVFRFGYITDGSTMMMISVPLIATVTGTE